MNRQPAGSPAIPDHQTARNSFSTWNRFRENSQVIDRVHYLATYQHGKNVNGTTGNLSLFDVQYIAPLVGHHGAIYSEGTIIDKFPIAIPGNVTGWSLITALKLYDNGVQIMNVTYEIVNTQTGVRQLIYNPFASGGAVNIGTTYQIRHQSGTLAANLGITPGQLLEGELVISTDVSNPRMAPVAGGLEVWYGVQSAGLWLFN